MKNSVVVSALLATFSVSMLGLISQTAIAEIGGSDADRCSDGSGICTSASSDFNQNGFFGRQSVVSIGLPSSNMDSNNPFRLSFNIEINDYFNVFYSVGEVTALVRTHAYGYHRARNDFSRDVPVVLKRDYGTRVLRGSWNVDLVNNFGAEYVEYATAVEVFLPGQAPITISL